MLLVHDWQGQMVAAGDQVTVRHRERWTDPLGQTRERTTTTSGEFLGYDPVTWRWSILSERLHDARRPPVELNISDASIFDAQIIPLSMAKIAKELSLIAAETAPTEKEDLCRS